ncbi:hypothetical protein IV203_038743 [Nitzschia inconspicua]|uniref:PDZ domain-containing protein n=1 Tax=Nitzschia inconspicua TaxID=303405 RepID=A0A9K3LN36_9STRA|nr:hypothetical protein IV203_038743 [Nitzschia inconspicua]
MPMDHQESPSPLTPQRPNAPGGNHKSPMKHSGGFVKSLFLPGFTDAGANTAFQKSANIDTKEMRQQQQQRVIRTTPLSPTSLKFQQQQQKQQYQYQRQHDTADTFSEAATELHDNRTKIHILYSSKASTIMTDTVTPSPTVTQTTATTIVTENTVGTDDTPRTTVVDLSQSDDGEQEEEGVEVEVKYDFFPSTKPSPSPRRPITNAINGTNASPQFGMQQQEPTIQQQQKQQQQQQQLSPAEEHERKILPYQHSNNMVRSELYRSTSTTTSIVALVGDGNDTDDSTSNNTNNNNDNVPTPATFMTRRLDATALQEQDQTNIQTRLDYNGNKRDDDNDDDDDDDDDGASNVSSTASEMGTVINLGNHAARMKEIEELAAMIEAEETEQGQDEDESADEKEQHTSLVDGIDDDEENVPHIEPPPKLSNSLLQNDSGLDLPILESKSFEKPTLLPSNRKFATTVNAAVDLGLGRLYRPSHLPKDESTNTSTDRSNDNNYSLEVNAGCRIESAHNTPIRDARLSTSEMLSATMRRLGPMPNHLSSSQHNSRSNTYNNNINDSLSAPPTPRTPAPPQAPRVEDLLRSTLTPSRQYPQSTMDSAKPPPSFALRSPGSAARFSLSQSSRQRRGLANNPLPKTRYPQERSTSVSTNIAGVTMSPRVAISQTFQLAQKCFSFDNTYYEEYSVDDFEDEDDLHDQARVDRMRRKLSLHSSHQSTIRLTPRVSPLEAASSFGGYSQTSFSTTSGGLRHSQSWDVGVNGINNARQAIPFRQTRSSLQHPSLHHPFGLKPIEDDSAFPDEKSGIIRGRISSDFSPSKVSKQQMELQTPQRIEIEREDALDILACLVEQGVADWSAQKTNQVSSTEEVDGANSSSTPPNSDIINTEKEEKSDVVDSASGTDHKAMFLSDSVIKTTIQEIRQWSESRQTTTGDQVDKVDSDHARRMEVLEDLLKSRQYAVEMKRAATSASSWLCSIGRGKTTTNADKQSRVATDHNITGTSASSKMPCNSEDENEDDNHPTQSSKLDSLTFKALLHSAQLELSEMQRANANLNEELSKCRAEIGRLKSMPRSEHVNRSILDDSHDTESSVTALSEAISKDAPVSPIARSRSFSDGEEDVQLLSVSVTNPVDNSIFQGMSQEAVKERVNETGQLDLLVMKAALENANEIIRKLHGELRNKSTDGDDVGEAPVVDVPAIETLGSPSKTNKSSAASSPDHRTVNVRMLDGENFVTDWDDLRPSLPPPPDHGLRSPIVMAILEQWTSDRTLHDSLLNWMEHVMKGDNLDDLPPLTISSLDHIVRDGFTMHVLPLLLRRADIHVAVQTRAHRRTTYDMAVTVSQKSNLIIGLDAPVPLPPRTQKYIPPEHPSLLDRPGSTDFEGDEWARNFQPRMSSGDSVATSAVTVPLANIPPGSFPPPQTPRRSPRRSPQPSPVAYTSFANQMRTRTLSGDVSDDQRYQPYELQKVPSGTLMGALGGALSGLLSRNKYAAASPGRLPSTTSHDRETSNMGATLRAQLDLTSSPIPGQSTHYNHRAVSLVGMENQSKSGNDHFSAAEEQQQPYHRVVSAPPGRIGVTFVEFRGHAMVSDVAMDSPLSGWVFPSDVLIAVDEIPVSGMRVRDIVKILSNRKDRQRAMRVISSHDMNEFTSMAMNGSYQGTLEEVENEDGE